MNDLILQILNATNDKNCRSIDDINEKYYVFSDHPDLVYIIDKKTFKKVGTTSLIEMMCDGIITEKTAPVWKRD